MTLLLISLFFYVSKTFSNLLIINMPTCLDHESFMRTKTLQHTLYIFILKDREFIAKTFTIGTRRGNIINFLNLQPFELSFLTRGEIIE
jgi:hypothetical protein